MTAEPEFDFTALPTFPQLRDQGSSAPLGPDWRVPSSLPRCNETATRCEIWAPSPAFGLPTEREKRLAAKLYGEQRGEEGWHYDPKDRAEKPGWIVARRILPEPEAADETGWWQWSGGNNNQ